MMLYILTAINVVSFVIMGIDKLRAVKSKWRIKESLLITLAICFGAVGIWVGMSIFKHKTKKVKFQFVQIIMIIQLGIIYYVTVHLY